MTIDTPSGADRLNRELHTQPRNRTTPVGLAVGSGSRGAGAVALVALVRHDAATRGPGTDRQSLGPDPPRRLALQARPRDRRRDRCPEMWLPDGYEFNDSRDLPRWQASRRGTCTLRPNGCFGDSSLVVVSVDTGGRESVPVPTARSVPGSTWAPTGATSSTSCPRPPTGSASVFTYDVTTGRSTKITNIPLERAWWWSLVWSVTVDGRVLYDLPTDLQESADWNVWQVPIDGGAPVLRVRNARAPEALPDGTIAYVVPRKGSWEGSAVAIVDQNGLRRTWPPPRPASAGSGRCPTAADSPTSTAAAPGSSTSTRGAPHGCRWRRDPVAGRPIPAHPPVTLGDQHQCDKPRTMTSKPTSNPLTSPISSGPRA